MASGCEESYFAANNEVTAQAAIHHLARDTDNPSSIVSCLDAARRNARAIRTAITADMWEAVNTAWIESRSFEDRDFAPDRLRRFLEYVKTHSLQFGGAVENTMLRREAFWFTRIGIHIERVDNTARILDVKYHVLLPEHSRVGGGIDYYQWTAILRAVSALRSYHVMFRDRIHPWQVAELLLLRDEMPRSLASNFGSIVELLELLARAHGRRGEPHRLAGRIHAELRFGRIEDIFQFGLHEFLTKMIDDTDVLGQAISDHYLT
jgi:uncharacterized alpha-E superfamily protein